MFQAKFFILVVLFFPAVDSRADRQARLSRRQTWQWPSSGFGSPSSSSRSIFGRSDPAPSGGLGFGNFFNQNFASSSPFGTFSFQPSVTSDIFANSPTKFGSPFKSFSDIASSFGSNRQSSSPNVDNFFGSNILPQQRPAPAASGHSMALQQAPSFPQQTWDSSSPVPDLQTQINTIFRQNGMWSLPQNFVQDKFNEAWAKSTQQFGSAGTGVGGLPAASGFSSLQFGSPGSQSNMFAGTSQGSLDNAKNAFTLEDFSKSLSQQ